MKKILRVSTYPTTIFQSMGLNSYKISGMNSFKTIYVTPLYKGKLLPNPKNTKVYSISFLTTPSPNWPFKIIHEIRRIFHILKFSLLTIIILIKEKPNIVHIHSIMYLLIAIYAKIIGIRCYITFHGNEHKFIYKKKILGIIFNNIFFKTFSLSTQILEYRKKYPSYSNKFVAINNGIDQSLFVDKKFPRKKVIVTVGRLEKQKDHKTLLRAFSELNSLYPNYQLLIIGAGQLENSLKKLTLSLNISQSVQFLGMIPQNRLIKIYNNSEIFVLSSLWEGFPKVLLEAMSCGCKIVATKVDSIPKVLGLNYPFLVKPNNEDDLFNKLKNIIENEQNVKFRYSKILKKYSWENIIYFMEKEYSSTQV